MADTTISALPAAASAQLTDVFPVDQSGVTYKETLQQLLTLISAGIIKNFAGNPNGNVAGTIYNFCWDTADDILYICTTTGTTSSAVWTSVGGGLVTPTEGGTGVSNPTAHGIAVAEGSSNFQFKTLTNGQLLIGSNGADPVAATLSAGAGIIIGNTAGGISIAATNTFGANTTVVWVNVEDGDDSSGDGSSINPYATITHANSTITDNSADKPYTIILSGIANEPAIAIKPFVSIFGLDIYSSGMIVGSAGTNALLLDSSWTSASSPTANIANIYFRSNTGVSFFTSMFGSNATINIENCLISGDATFTGNESVADQILIQNTTVEGNLSVENMVFNTTTCVFDNPCSYLNSSIAHPMVVTSKSDIFYNSISVEETFEQDLTFNATSGSLQNTMTVTGDVAAFYYDAVSYPQQGITLASGALAFPLISAPNIVPITFLTEIPSAYTYNALPSDYIILCSNSSHAIEINLITSDTNVFIIKDSLGNAAIHNITVNGNGSDIDGESTYVINTNYGSITVVGNGDGWSII